MTDTSPTVVDNTDEHRFVLIQDGVEAELIYEIRGNELILAEVEVPRVLSGRGIGGMLVRAALERATRTGETVLPWCSYARHWLQKHYEEAAAIVVDWSEPPEEGSTASPPDSSR